MKCSPLLIILTSGALLSCLSQASAKAQETIALSFDLPDPYPNGAADAAQEATSSDNTQENTLAVAPSTPAPLPIPAAATNPPQSKLGSDRLPTSVYRNNSPDAAIATATGPGVQPLPPPPGMDAAVLAIAQSTQSAANFQTQAARPDNPQPRQSRQFTSPDLTAPAKPDKTPDIALHFDLGPSAADLAIAQAPPPRPPLTPAEQLQAFFEGNSDSLVARAVGSAEGTRTANGDRTAAFYGHTDPGNSVWNMGTFSYQHGAKTPEEADERQLQRLQKQAQVLMNQADAQGLTLTLEEKLNAIDLANQAPATAMGRYGYVQRLAEARQMGLQGQDAIVWARTYAFKNPETQRWNAPGLGNTLGGVTRDQERRMKAIARAITAYEQQYPDDLALQIPNLNPQPTTAASAEPPSSTTPTPTPTPEDILFQLWPDQPQAHQPRSNPPLHKEAAVAPPASPVAEPASMATTAATTATSRTTTQPRADGAVDSTPVITMPGLEAANQSSKLATAEASQTIDHPKDLSMPSGEPLEQIFTLDTPPTMANF